MEAPDKIYLTVDKNEDWKYAMWTTRCPQERKFSELDKHEEYIRKDALLEWAVYMRDKNQFGNYEYSLFQTIIDKLNSM